jgi:nucleoside-diphosphate-sugar epimerase
MTQTLLTGADGFIGSYLSEYLFKQGSVVLPVVRSNHKIAKAHAIGNIDANSDWTSALQGCTSVVHLAGVAHGLNGSNDQQTQLKEVNTDGTLKLARQAVAAGVTRMVFISSIGVNGNQTFDQPFSASSTPKPHSPYAASKYAAELGLKELAASGAIEIVVIRPPLVYGANAPGSFGQLVKVVRRGLPLPFGLVTNNKRSLVSLENLSSLVALCLKHPSAANQTFLVSDGEDISTADLLKRLSAAMGKEPRLLPIPPKLMAIGASMLGKKAVAQQLLGNLQVNIEHTKNSLNWSPLQSLNDGLKIATTGV